MLRVEHGERHHERQHGEQMERGDEPREQRDRTHVVAADMAVEPVHPHGAAPSASDQNLIATGSSISTRSMPRSNGIRTFILNRRAIVLPGNWRSVAPYSPTARL